MNDNQQRRLDKYEREMAFVADNAVDFPSASPGGKIADAQNTDITLIKQLASEQISAAGSQQIGLKDEALDEIYLLIRMMSRAADAMEDEIPGVEDLFPLPRNRSEQNILAAARNFAAAAAPYEAKFIEYDLPTGFLANLQSLITAAETAAINSDKADERTGGATGGIKAAMTRCGERSKKLGAIVKNKYVNNPQKLAAWLVASHLERAPKPAKPPTP